MEDCKSLMNNGQHENPTFKYLCAWYTNKAPPIVEAPIPDQQSIGYQNFNKAGFEFRSIWNQ